jgi:hypothetical protein
MDDLLKMELPVQCPGGGRTEKMRLDKILSSSSIRTSKGEYKIKSASKSKMNSHLRKMEMEKTKYERMMSKMMDDFNDIYAELFKTADIIIKR